MGETRLSSEQAMEQAQTRGRGLRADARRNLDRILVAAREVFLEQGGNVALDEIARRAGVGVATLYRRFPDRQSLARDVALDVWRRVADEARQALAEEPTAFQAMERYLRRALDLGVGAVMPLLVSQTILDDEARAARDESAEHVRHIIAAAKAEGTLRADAAESDIGLSLIRLSRPLPGPIPRALDRALAHRHIDLLLAGLRAEGAPPVPLSGPVLSLDDLSALADE